MDASYWTTLATDYVNSFTRVFGDLPSKHCVLFAMAVGEFETQSGRAWPGSNNVGAVHLRRLTTDELAAFHAGTLKAGDRIPGNPGGILHVDTAPTANGPIAYPVWFATFPTQVDGITYFLKVLYKVRPNCKAAGDDPNGTLLDLATAQYVSGYFEGNRSGARPVGQRTPPFTEPELANIHDYATGLSGAATHFMNVLTSWEPDPAPITQPIVLPPVAPYDLNTIRGQQAALSFLATKMNHSNFNPLGVDGIHGPHTDAAIHAFQIYAHLPPTGDVDPCTVSALKTALVSAGAPT
jgi:hypothetical protein